MSLKIPANNILLFKFFSKEDLALLSQHFEVFLYSKDEIVLSYGDPVPGIYIINHGAIEVSTEDFVAVLATLEKGSAFGEMAIIEEGETASANLKVQSDEAQILFCSKEKLLEIITKSDALSSAFYHGTSLLLSRRLRQTNVHIVEEIQKAHDIISKILEDSNILTHIGTTKNNVNDTGSNLVGGMFRILPILTDISKEKGEVPAQLEQATKEIEEILLHESHNFDKISQQLDLILQYFSNIQRLVKGDRTLDIKGDPSLLIT